MSSGTAGAALRFPPMDGEFELLDESVAAVYAVPLDGGGRAVLKLHSPIVGASFLLAVQRVQRHLARAGFPCPLPLAPPTRLGARLVTAESLLDAGETPDGHDTATRAAMAAGLARLVALCRPLVHLAGLRENPWREGEPGAGRLVVGHTDWRAQNMRLERGRLSAVYDWESLDVLEEPALVGGAAAAFTADWTHGPASFPCRDESKAFVAEYERARRRRFSATEMETVRDAFERRREYIRSHMAGFDEEQA